MICFFYWCGLVGLAFWLEKQDKGKYRQFLNLLWVLGCSFTFILGAYIAIRVIGPAFKDDSSTNNNNNSGSGGSSSGTDVSESSLAGLLPSNASATLVSWASASRWQTTEANYGGFGSSMYFNGLSEGSNGNNILLRASGSDANEVVPWLRNAKDFEQYSSSLFFLASDNATGHESLWKITSGSPESATEAISRSELNIPDSGDVMSVTNDPDTAALYLKGYYRCSSFSSSCWSTVYTLLESDGTPAGTTDLRGSPSDVCTTVCAESNPGSGSGSGNGGPGEAPKAEVWAVIFLGIVPMMLLAGFVLIRKQLPGPFVNLYGGFQAIVILVMLVVADEAWLNSGNNFANFLKWFLTSYNSVFWLVLAFWSLARETIPEWQEELKSWAVVFVGVSFFVMIHIDLEIPFKDESWRWVVYALLTVAQLLMSAIVSRTVPMVAGAVGLFVLAWKIAIEIVKFAGLEGEYYMLSVLVIMAVQGAGIVLGAIWYSSQREKLDAMVVALLRCQTAKVKELRGQDYMTPGSTRVDV